MTGKPINPNRHEEPTSQRKTVWGLPKIAEALGVPVDSARALANQPDTPISRPGGGGYFAYLSDLYAWKATNL